MTHESKSLDQLTIEEQARCWRAITAVLLEVGATPQTHSERPVDAAVRWIRDTSKSARVKKWMREVEAERAQKNATRAEAAEARIAELERQYQRDGEYLDKIQALLSDGGVPTDDKFGSMILFERVQWVLDRNAFLERVLDEARERDSRERFIEHMQICLGVDTPCDSCGGIGRKTYANTTTWRNGAGGQALRADVCDSCWGTGDANRSGTNLRSITSELEAAEARIAELERERDAIKANARAECSRVVSDREWIDYVRATATSLGIEMPDGAAPVCVAARIALRLNELEAAEARNAELERQVADWREVLEWYGKFYSCITASSALARWPKKGGE